MSLPRTLRISESSGLVEDQLDADRGGEVEADVGRRHALVDQLLVEDRALDELDRAGSRPVARFSSAPC